MTHPYDITIIHDSENEDIEMEGDTGCPDCGEPVFPGLTDDVMEAALDAGIVAPFDCPECDADLEFIIERTFTEEVGLGISVVRS